MSPPSCGRRDLCSIFGDGTVGLLAAGVVVADCDRAGLRALAGGWVTRLLVFLHGTTIMHAGGVGRTRAERAEQVRSGADPSVADYAAYVPIGDAVGKLQRWREQGADITYLSSHRNPDDVAKDAAVLRGHGFPPGPVLARRAGENYGELVGRELPEVLIEDDCESIGAAHVAYPQVRPDLQARITSIVVPEFGGIDHLPDSLPDLLALNP
jgi:hypothetical protein